MTKINEDRMWITERERSLGLLKPEAGWVTSVSRQIGKDTWFLMVRPARFVKAAKPRRPSNATA